MRFSLGKRGADPDGRSEPVNPNGSLPVAAGGANGSADPDTTRASAPVSDGAAAEASPASSNGGRRDEPAPLDDDRPTLIGRPDPGADDVASYALDLMAQNDDFRRASLNPLFLTG